jgi:F-type H+-transporting ATPase subunit epsilon
MATPSTTARGGGGLQVSVISPERMIFEGEADSVVVPAWDGELGILRGHAPLMALLGTGHIRISRGGRTERFQISGGFLQVVNDRVSVLSERAEEA